MWSTGTPGWIHTSYDNSTSTATMNWVESDDLENHLKVATLTIMRIVTKMGDFGSGLPPAFSKFDGKVDSKDLALFIRVYRGLAPPEAMYLADLGGGLPPQFFKIDGVVDSQDLALFIKCYRGFGPPEP